MPNEARNLNHLVRSLATALIPGSRPGAHSASNSKPTGAFPRVERASRAAFAERRAAEEGLPAGEGWARPEYGRYMATSPSVYSAVKLRADAVTRPPLLVYRHDAGNSGGFGSATSSRLRTRVEPTHPVVRLLERVNPWYTRGDLWRATEIYLCLWGAAFWAIERGDDGEPELWPLRPDRMAVIPDRRRYVRGFVYRGNADPVAYTPEEIIWLRYFNPMEELAGLSPLAPARLSADMGHEGLLFNRNLLRNSARPDFLLLTNQEMNETELEEFYTRWESRYRGGGQLVPSGGRVGGARREDAGVVAPGSGLHPGAALESGGS